MGPAPPPPPDGAPLPVAKVAAPPPPPGDVRRTPIEYLSETVGRHFKVRHIEGDRFRIAFFARETAAGVPVKTDSPEVDQAFDALRVELKEFSYVPTLQVAGEDGVITISRIVDPTFRSSRVNWVFFLLTLLSVQTAGAVLWSSYVSPHGPTGAEAQLDWLSAEAQIGGALFFALPLLSILGLHEMGHFFTARHYKVRASLPFFIPSLPPLGTFGAFISMRDPLPSRRVIFDIGLSGPVVGFLASILVTAVGAVLMQGNPSPVRPEFGNGVNLGTPIMFDLILNGIGTAENSYLHPTLFAGWAGFLVTAFNLIPAAQLDGGHVMFSLLGNGARRQSRAVAISALAVIGIAVLGSLLGYTGWLLLIVIVFLTIRHPPPLNQISSLDLKRLIAGICGLLVFAVSFSPAPISLIAADYTFETSAQSLSIIVPAGGEAVAAFNVTNLGNTFNELRVEVRGSSGPFTATFEGSNTSTHLLVNRLEFINRTVNVTVAALTLLEGEQGAIYLVVSATEDPNLQTPVVVYARSGPAHPAFALSAPGNVSAAPGASATADIEAVNTGDVPLNLTFNVSVLTSSWAWGFGELGNVNATLRIAAGGNATVRFVVLVPAGAVSGDSAAFTVSAADGNWTAATADVSFTARAGA